MPKLIQVIESQVVKGKGSAMDVARQVTQYHTTDGVLLAEHDPCTPQIQRNEYGGVQIKYMDIIFTSPREEVDNSDEGLP